MKIYGGTDHKTVIDLSDNLGNMNDWYKKQTSSGLIKTSDDCRVDLGSSIIPKSILHMRDDGTVVGISTRKMNVPCIIHPNSGAMYIRSNGKSRYWCTKCSPALNLEYVER